MKTITMFLFAAFALLGQNGTPVRVADDPPQVAVQQVFVISGSNTVAVCYSPSVDGGRSGVLIAISAISKATPAVITSTGHGLDTNSRPQVVVSGATGTGWSAINGTFTATVIDANTFSVAVDSTGFGTLGGAVVFSTTAPRKTIAEWAVKKIAYDGSNNAVWIGWLNGNTTYHSKCSDATSSTVVQQ